MIYTRLHKRNHDVTGPTVLKPGPKFVGNVVNFKKACIKLVFLFRLFRFRLKLLKQADVFAVHKISRHVCVITGNFVICKSRFLHRLYLKCIKYYVSLNIKYEISQGCKICKIEVQHQIN